MKIFFNGDSHTSGSELLDPKNDTYSYKLAKLLNAEIVDNPAIGGASNDRILRTTEDFLRDCKEYPDLIVIGWSESIRFDWFYDGQYRSCGSEEFDRTEAEPHDPIRHEHLRDTMRGEVGYAHSYYQQNQMYNLHEKLNYLNIPHLFFNAHRSFHYCLTRTKTFLPNVDLFIYNWNDCFWNPYHEIDGCFLDWGNNRGYSVTRYNHLESKAHTEFAKLLFDYINDNII